MRIRSAGREACSGEAVPEVSVILPCHNMERYLRQCLDSLLDQTLADVEIIGVNDASTDGTLSILREYEAMAPSRIRVIDLIVNRSAGGARNAGLDVARGTFVTFVDPDDWVDPGMCETLLSAAHSTGADIVVCDHYEYREDGTLRPIVGFLDAFDGTTRPRSGRILLQPCPPWKMLIRRGLLEDFGLRFPEGVRVNEDYALTSVLLALANRIAKVSRCLYFYRVRAESVSNIRHDSRKLEHVLAAEHFLLNAERLGLAGLYPQEVAQRFTELYYVHGVVYALRYFDSPRVDHLKAVRARMRREFPHYRKNRYFRELPMSRRVLTFLNDLHPLVLATAFQIARASRLDKVARACFR